MENHSIMKAEKESASLAEASLSNRFLFAQVMKDEELAAELLRLILPGEKIGKVHVVEAEKTIENKYSGRGVRLDIYLLGQEESMMIFNLEMQRQNVDYIPKRSRYYQSSADVEMLKQGQKFSDLPDSYVIFICTFDLFHKGRCLYTFRNRCNEEEGLELGDGTCKVFVNCNAWEEAENEELKGFLYYINHSTEEAARAYDSPFMRRLHSRVTSVKEDDDMSMAYTVWKAHQEEAMWIGEQRGRELGKELGEERFSMLVKRLISDGRSGELERVASDAQFRKEIFEEYGIYCEESNLSHTP